MNESTSSLNKSARSLNRYANLLNKSAFLSLDGLEYANDHFNIQNIIVSYFVFKKIPGAVEMAIKYETHINRRGVFMT